MDPAAFFSSFGESRGDACSFWFSDWQAETRSRIVLNTHKLEATTTPIDSQMMGTWQSVLSKNCWTEDEGTSPHIAV